MMRQGRACLLLWGRRYCGGDVELWATRCYKFIYKLMKSRCSSGTLGAKLVAHRPPQTSGHVLSDFCSAVLRGVLTEQH